MGISLYNFPKLEIECGATLAQRKFQLTHTPQMTTHSYLAYNFSINQTLKLPHNYELELNAWHNGSQFDGATRISDFGMVNLGIGKKLNRDRGTLQLTVTDLLKTMRLSAYIGHLTPLVFQLRSVSNYRSESAWARIFRLSYSRNFGNVLNKEKRKSGADEERERVRE
ncbi:MAG: outer membrane beta-barrel protein [Haliscomenobacter sp.]|nr:outer membrane beta-barrel protein [Haliscomenobacter sp.]MBK9488439.1 outer membrane beta-barrel protein [Haliscomenobacter sp.]